MRELNTQVTFKTEKEGEKSFLKLGLIEIEDEGPIKSADFFM